MSRALARKKPVEWTISSTSGHIGVGQGLQGGEAAIESGGDLIDPLVGTLGGQPGGKEKLVILLVLQGADSVRIQGLERLYNGDDILLAFHNVSLFRLCIGNIISQIVEKSR